MNDPDLTTLLERATDHLVPAPTASRVWARAQRTRRRRAAGAGVAAVATVVLAVAVVTVPSGDEQPRPPVTTPSRTDSAPTPPPAPAADPLRWDPFTLADEPRSTSVLPARLGPPASAPDVLDSPDVAAAIAWPERGRDLAVLGVDGVWRQVPGTADALTGPADYVLRPTISPDGEQIAMSTDDGILVIDLPARTQRVLVWPSQISEQWDGPPSLRWLPGDEQLVVLHWRHTWQASLDGSFERAPFEAGYGDGLAVDPDGPVFVSDLRSFEIVEYAGDQVVDRVPGPDWGSRFTAGEGLLGFTGGPGGAFTSGPVVLDAGTGEQLAAASIRDRDSVYADNGHLTVEGFLDDHTALLLVGPTDFRTMEQDEETWYLASWDFRDGSFTRLAEGDSRMSRIDVAPDVLGFDAP